METQRTTSYEPFRVRHALQLAAPRTWPASVISVLLAVALSLSATGTVSATMAMVLLCICVLMQSSVNTFNDYFDFVKGVDSEDDVLEADDSTLVNDHINPRAALGLAIALLVFAFALGIFVIIQCGLIPLWIALIGGAAVILYSAGKTPISSLPLGEVVSGVVMGGLIPLACVYCLTGAFDLMMLVFALPEIIGIGLIMMTNNTCDKEKDIDAGRRTLPSIIGRTRAKRVYQALLVIWMVLICLICAIWFRSSVIMLPFMLLVGIPLAGVIWNNPLTQQTRIAAMGAIASLNIVLGTFYALCIVI